MHTCPQRGACRFGPSCRFSHDGGATQADGGKGGTAGPKPSDGDAVSNRGYKSNAQKREETRDVAAIMRDENLLDANTMQQLDEIDTMTGCPVDEDTLFHGVAMCAPLIALQNFKYKVKLVPGAKKGGMKKGRAIKFAVDQLLRTAGSTEGEERSIKALPETELTRTMMSNCKVVKCE